MSWLNRYTIIGITGKARSGKDTVMGIIQTHVRGLYCYRMAGPLKNMLAAIEIDVEGLSHGKDEIIPLLGVSPRRMMQTLGTEWGRTCVHPNFWVILAQRDYMQNGPGMIIPDIRYENEAAFVRGLGGRIIHVQRPNIAPVETHSSEDGIEIQPEDWVIVNDGDIQDLHDKLDRLFNESKT